MTYAFLIALAVGLAGCGILLALWKGAEVREANTVKALELARHDVTATQAALQISEKAREVEKARLEAVIAGLKADIASLESDLHACNSPDLVRERLRRLLSSPVPAPASGVGVGPYGTVPFGAPAKPSGG